MPGGIAQRPVMAQRQLEQMCPQKDRLLRGGEHLELAADTELERELANDLVAEGVKRSDRDIALTERRQQVWASLFSTNLPPTRRSMMLGSRAMRLGLRGVLTYSAASVGAGAFYAFNNFVISLLLKPMGAPDLVIGLLSSTRSLEGALVQ